MQAISPEDIVRRIRTENPWWDGDHTISQTHQDMKRRAYFDLFFPLVKTKSVRRAVVLMGRRRVGKTVMIYHAVHYSGSRQYVVENSRFHVRGTMKVQVQAQPNGSKRFQIVEISGPPAIRKMVFQRMLDTEAAASAASSQESTRIPPENYSFWLVGKVTQNGKRLGGVSLTWPGWPTRVWPNTNSRDAPVARRQEPAAIRIYYSDGGEFLPGIFLSPTSV